MACLELHTFSSLNKDFLPEYQHTLDAADLPVVYYNPKTLEHKRMPALSAADITGAFGNNNLQVFTNSIQLADYLKSLNWENQNLLLMSSGNYNNMDLQALSAAVLHPKR